MKCKRTIFIAATLCAIALQAAAQDVEDDLSFVTPCTIQIMRIIHAAPAPVNPPMEAKEYKEVFDIHDAFFEPMPLVCHEKDNWTTLKQVATVAAGLKYLRIEAVREQKDLAKKYNSLLRNYDELLSAANELVNEVKVLREEKRALQMGQDLLLRLQAISSTISSAPPPPRRLHCKSRTTGAIMPFGSFAGVTSTSNIRCTEE